MNRKVASLTGIRDSLLREKGVSFPEAAAQFAAWCGEDCVFLTWGFDDITILRENLAVFGLESGWTARWYNAQLIFNAQTDGSGAQKALSTAMQMMDIAPHPCRARRAGRRVSYGARLPEAASRGGHRRV